MSDLDALIKAIDALPREDFDRLLQHMRERRTIRVGIVPPENLARLAEVVKPLQADAEKMTEEEINSLIDEAIAEVRRDRKAKSRH